MTKKKGKKKRLSKSAINSLKEDIEKGEIDKTSLRRPSDREEEILFALTSDILGYMQKKHLNQRSLAAFLDADPSKVNHMVHYRIDQPNKSNIYRWHEKLFPDVSKIQFVG